MNEAGCEKEGANLCMLACVSISIYVRGCMCMCASVVLQSILETVTILRTVRHRLVFDQWFPLSET